MITRFCAAAALSIAALGAAKAENPLPRPGESARYSMAVVDGGVMRLDGATGRLSFCAKSGTNFDCKAVNDDRSSYMDEIEALAKQNADLKKQIGDGGASLRMPKDADLDRAFGLMERFVKRFGDQQAPQ